MAENEKEKIMQDYLSGVTPKEISEIYGISLNTIKSWIKRYGWSKLKKAAGAKKGCEGAPSKKVQSEGTVENDLENVEKFGDLNEKQKNFCLYYIRSFNATKAYMKAYGVKYETAGVSGHRLLENDKIKKCIADLKKNRMNRELLHEDDIFQKYMDIAFADYTDYVEFGVHDAPVIGAHGPVLVKDKKGDKVPLTTKESFVRVKNSEMVDGTLIAEIRQDRGGVSIKLADRMKALQWLTDHMDLATEEQKARVEMMRAKMGPDGQQTAEDKVAKLFEAIGGALDAEFE